MIPNRMIMKKILVPTDFSPCAENAVEVALKIAEKSKAQIIFQHLYAEKSGIAHVPVQTTALDPDRGLAKSKLDELVMRAGNMGLDALPLFVLNEGNDKIENYIDPMSIDLVVMGSHGATGFRELIIGSQTQRVVRHSSAPVLVIKHKPEKSEFTDILFPSTFHEDVSNALRMPVELASLWNGTVHLLYVGLEKDKQTKAEIEAKMKRAEEKFSKASFTRNFITTNDPEWGIKHPAKEIGPQMIALTTQLKTGAFIFNHSLAENLVNRETLPVLVINTNS